jgi:ABC-2 type transport system permease protein
MAKHIDHLRLLLSLIRISIRAQMQYRANFILWTLAQFLIVGTEFGGIWALFARFGGLQGWKIPEICLLYGIVNIAFALAEMGGRGFDQFSGIIKGGDFDRFLLRPRPTALLLAGQIFEMTRLGRALMGAVILTYGITQVEITWTIAKGLLLFGAIVGGTCLFYGILILQATLCFWTVESLEVVNAVTYGGITAAEMPLTIYPKGLRYLFTYIVPIACLNYVPLSVLLDRGEVAPWLSWASPLMGVLFLIFAFPLWHLGERHYTSTGS